MTHDPAFRSGASLKRRLRVLAPVLAVILLGWLWSQRGARYEGRTVRGWFEYAVRLTPQQYRLSKCRQAFNALGDDTVQFLKKCVEAEPTRLDQLYGRLHRGSPEWLKKALPPARIYSGYYQVRKNFALKLITDILVSRELHRKIVQRSSGTPVISEAEMRPYTNVIPGTSVRYRMVPVPSGEFLMGSPPTEVGRRADEGPQLRVKLDAFWMGQFEVTWDQFNLFLYPKIDSQIISGHPTNFFSGKVVDAISRPSRPYIDHSMGMGTNGLPAVNMTQHAANKFCEWLSGLTGHSYRLPTEAEWEYACRAGTTTAYYFGERSAQLGQYGWFEGNSDWKYEKVGRRTPNAWGLYDMHGNVAEWTLDQYDPDFYARHLGMILHQPWNRAARPYPHSVRGGSWQDPPERLRSAARFFSSPDWKEDPSLPKSIWYHTRAQFVGFRIVRPLRVPSVEEVQDYWNSGVEFD